MWLLAITSAVLLVFVLLVSAWPQTNISSDYANVDSSFDESHFEQDALPSVDVEPGGPQRPNYRYSVIAGGAYNELELRQAVHNDPVVAAHYEHLDQSKLRVERVLHDRYVHVSYRRGTNIFWTKNKVLLRQGETILTDGKTQVRARCGNCISEEPQLPTAADEPDTVEFDRLTDAPTRPSDARSGETALVPIAPMAAPSSGPAVAGVAPSAASPDPLAAGRFSTGGPPLPLAARGPIGGTPGPSPDLPVGDRENPAGPPPTLFPLPPDAPTIPTGFDNPFSAPGDNPELPPGITDLTPPGSPEEPANPVPVPEPGTLLLVGGGVAAVIRKLRSRAS